jgi:hypothetical protein
MRKCEHLHQNSMYYINVEGLDNPPRRSLSDNVDGITGGYEDRNDLDMTANLNRTSY